MRLPALLIFVGACALSQAQSASYRVIAAGRELGTATLSYKLTNGTLVTKMSMTLRANGQTFAVTSEDVARTDATPVSSTGSQSTPNGDEKKTLTYGPKGVTITTVTNGKSTTRQVPYPKGSIKKMSDFWFITVRPKVGAKSGEWSLDHTTLKWEQDGDTYAGDRDTLVKGKKVRAHLVQSKEADMLLDDKGLPYRVTVKQGGINMIWERS